MYQDVQRRSLVLWFIMEKMFFSPWKKSIWNSCGKSRFGILFHTQLVNRGGERGHQGTAKGTGEGPEIEMGADASIMDFNFDF